MQIGYNYIWWQLLEGQAEDIRCLLLMSIGLWGWSAQTILARGFMQKYMDSYDPRNNCHCSSYPVCFWEINSVCGDLLERVPLQLRFMSLRCFPTR